MVNARQVAIAAKNIALAPARLVDGVALRLSANVFKYVLVHSAPWAWNKIPAGFKTGVQTHLLDGNSRVRHTLDSLVTVAGALAVADAVGGPNVAIYREIGEFYANYRLAAIGGTLVGAGTLAALAMKRGRYPYLAYVACVLAGAGIVMSSLFFQPPVGIGGSGTGDGRKPAAVEQKPLTRQDLETYVESTLLPQFQQGMGEMSEEQRNAFQDYVTQFVASYVAQQIAKGGYVTGSDLEKLGQQVSGQISNLESSIRAAQAAPVPVPATPTPTAVPPTSTPIAAATPAPTPAPVNFDAIVSAVRWGVSYELAMDMLRTDPVGFYNAFGVGPAAQPQVPAWFDGIPANGEVRPLDGIAVAVDEAAGKSRFYLQGDAAATFPVHQDPTNFLAKYLRGNPSRVGEVTVITPGQR